MRYVQPWGVTDLSAPYINGDPTIGQQGSIPPAAVFEHPQRELVAVIEKSGFIPSYDSLVQLAESVRSQALNYAEDISTVVNNITVAYDPPLTAYTRGLTLRIRIRNTNDGPCRLNAGAGTMPVRKMNGSDVGSGELPAGSVATFVYEGTAFQLSNFGGGGGTGQGDVFVVHVPYTVDLSPSPGMIIAEFSPPITTLAAGDLLAVKVANTTTGPTNMQINNLPLPLPLAPNGGGPVLQGDIAAGDVVQFFYDGTDLRFAPNPEMNAPVTYTVGSGQQFTDVAQAMSILKRKTIGANGYVTLLISKGVIDGPLVISHPSGDRICVRGTMIGPAPVWSDFAATGNSAQQRQQDAIYNINMLRTRFGTEVRLRDSQVNREGYGCINSGPGAVVFADLLIVGNQVPPVNGWWYQVGVDAESGFNITAVNVSVWGAQAGFVCAGTLNCNGCFAVGGPYIGLYCASGFLGFGGGAVLGNASVGIFLNFGTGQTVDAKVMMNGSYGVYANNNSGIQPWWTDALGNAGADFAANITSSIIIVGPANWGTTSPPLNTSGNGGSLVTSTTAARPPPR